MTVPMLHDRRIELKYRLASSLSGEVRHWAREHLGIDHHCPDADIDSYDVNTLYFDTPRYDLFHRSGLVGRTKHRIRRYGNEPTLWLESKRKKKDVVRKNRTSIAEGEVLARLPISLTDTFKHEPQSQPQDCQTWCGEWFLQRIAERRLQPAVQVHYQRFARMTTWEGQSLRLTIDSQLQASEVDGWTVASTADAVNRKQIDSDEVLELKFYNHMPALFKSLLRTFPIAATGFSKYRTAAERCVAAIAAQGVCVPESTAWFTNEYCPHG